MTKQRLAVVVLLLSNSLLAWAETASSLAQQSRISLENEETANLRRAVTQFCEQWLMAKNYPRTLRFFHRDAFRNKQMLSDSCTGYLKPEERAYPEAVRTAVNRFLRDYGQHARAKGLRDLLTFERYPGTDQINAKLINVPKEDGFCLVHSSNLAQIAERALDWPSLTSLFPAQRIVGCLATIHLMMEGETVEAPLYFLWANENGSWKIIQLGEYCP